MKKRVLCFAIKKLHKNSLQRLTFCNNPSKNYPPSQTTNKWETIFTSTMHQEGRLRSKNVYINLWRCSFFQDQDDKYLHLTRIVVTIVLVFLVLNLPRLVLGVFEISRLDRIGDEPYSPMVPKIYWLLKNVLDAFLVLLRQYTIFKAHISTHSAN